MGLEEEYVAREKAAGGFSVGWSPSSMFGGSGGPLAKFLRKKKRQLVDEIQETLHLPDLPNLRPDAVHAKLQQKFQDITHIPDVRHVHSEFVKLQGDVFATITSLPAYVAARALYTVGQVQNAIDPEEDTSPNILETSAAILSSMADTHVAGWLSKRSAAIIGPDPTEILAPAVPKKKEPGVSGQAETLGNKITDATAHAISLARGKGLADTMPKKEVTKPKKVSKPAKKKDRKSLPSVVAANTFSLSMGKGLVL